MFRNHFKLLLPLAAALLWVLAGTVLTGTALAETGAQPLPEGLTAKDWQAIQALIEPRSATAGDPTYFKASNTEPHDHFGWSVAIDGDTVVVGARYEDSSATGVDGYQGDDFTFGYDSGAAYLYDLTLFLPIAE